jgi:hypothetical protein
MALDAGIVLRELRPLTAELEDVFLELTAGGRDRLMGTFRSELRKLTTVRTTTVLTLAGWALLVLGSAFLIFSNGRSTETGMPTFGGAFTGSSAEVAGVIDQIGGSSIIVLVVGLAARDDRGAPPDDRAHVAADPEPHAGADSPSSRAGSPTRPRSSSAGS